MGINASTPPIHPGSHIRHNSATMSAIEACVNNPNTNHIKNPRNPGSDAFILTFLVEGAFENDVCTFAVCSPSKYFENPKNLFNILPPIS